MQSSPGIRQWLSFVCDVVRAFEAIRKHAQEWMNVLGVGTACWATKRVDVPNAAGAFRVRSVAHWLDDRDRTIEGNGHRSLAQCYSLKLSFLRSQECENDNSDRLRDHVDLIRLIRIATSHRGP